MAAGLLRHALDGEDNKPPFRVDSAGIASQPGTKASENSIIAMKKVGIDLSKHKSSQLTPEQITQSAAVFCMTSAHLRMIEALFPTHNGQLRLFREYASSGSKEVPDPFGGDLDEYVKCRDSLLDAIPGMLRFLYQEVFPQRGG